MTPGSIRLAGMIVRGHRVASGANPRSPYPQGTISLQIPHFAQRGLDLSAFHPATLNVSTSPFDVLFECPAHRFEDVRWTDLHGPETFELVHVELELADRVVRAWGYRPTAETKADHPQPADVLEIIAPYLPEASILRELNVRLDPAEVRVERRGPERLGSDPG